MQKIPCVTLRQLPDAYGICRLDANAAVPEWADGPGFVSISRSDEELSILCPQHRIQDGIKCDRDWTCYKLLGPFAFDETGIVLSVIRPLSEEGLGIFIVSTFDGDHLLVKTKDVDRAHQLLTGANHTILQSDRS
ncbi:MAG: ACT domain-containing protein [Alphaproteobacteria bacterium]|nr:ACT domain-containing protein [Alphaproteobacteria bacterium]